MARETVISNGGGSADHTLSHSGGGDQEGTMMAETIDPIAGIRTDLKAMGEQVEAGKAASVNETDDVKAARAVAKAAKMLEDAVSYKGVFENAESKDVRDLLPKLARGMKDLLGYSQMIAPVAAFDRSVGNTLAGRLKLAAQMVEAGYLPSELGAEINAALEGWRAVKGSGGGASGPRAAKGQGELGYLLLVKHSSWDEARTDSTGIGSAMSSMLGKLGKTLDPKVSGAAKSTWEDAGHGKTYADLHKALTEVVKTDAEGAEYGDWIVSTEGKGAAAESEKKEEEAAA